MRLFALIIPLCLGCAVTSTQRAEPIAEELPQCPAGEFRGFGVAKTESEALSTAYAELAKQINSSIKVTTEYGISQQKYNGNENLSSKYESKSVMESDLSNAHDARVVYNKRNNVVVCMSRADAARGLLERQRLIADSLEMVSNAALNEKRPKPKKEAWNKTQMLWSRFMNIQSTLKSWGIESKHFESASGNYAKAREDYKYYCKNMKVHWEDSGNECSDASFARLSNKVKMEKSECSGGLRFRFACMEKCKAFSLGVECSFEPSLAIESCEGERYSMLRAKEPVTGSDMHNIDKAKESLIENLSKAVFFSEWEKEIEKWVPQCVD
ncbi:MAG: hypothetical protein LBB36_03355 [Fibromonadaceae bacterium]|jgi:hypothetical protein|nr:hypothetical protein [Fibromonadaceae bacterium]